MSHEHSACGCGRGCACHGPEHRRASESYSPEVAARIEAAVAAADLWMKCVGAFRGGVAESVQERAERTRLFEVPGACPPYEAAWIRRDKGAILGDIAGFYRAFGFEAVADGSSRHDHIGTIAEYLALVRVMEAKALAERRDEPADIALEAYVNFLRDHLGDWIVPFCTRLRASTHSKPMLAAADLLEHAWRSSAVVHGLPAFDQLEAAATPLDDQGTPYECDLGGDPCGSEECAPADATVPLTTSASRPSPSQ